MAGLKGTNIKRIGHNDLEYLEKVLKEVKGQYQTKLVIIDGVYSRMGICLYFRKLLLFARLMKPC